MTAACRAVDNAVRQTALMPAPSRYCSTRAVVGVPAFAQHGQQLLDQLKKPTWTLIQ